MQSIAGAFIRVESGRLDLNQRPPAPEAGQYTNQLLHSAGLQRETGRRCRSFPTSMPHYAGRNSPPNTPRPGPQAADQKASSGKFISELPPDIRVAKWVPLRGSIRCM